MDCIFASPLTDEQISLLLDGVSDEDLRSHINQCPACHRHFQEARQVETMLRKQLLRGDCPTSQKLADFQMGLLEKLEQMNVAKHLETCSTCREELRILSDFMASDEVEQNAYEGPENIIYPPDRYFEARILDLQAKAVRGGTKSQIHAVANNVRLFFDIQETSTGLALEGVLIAMDEQTIDWVGSFVEIRSSERVKSVCHVDKMHTFRCEPISEGVVNIRITSPAGYTIAVPSLQIRR
jgi:hypothetical protein